MKNLIVMLVIAGALVNLSEGDGGHEHVIIHVPYHVKTLKHTHTITKHIHHKPKEEDKYEVLGYTYGKPMAYGHEGGGGGDDHGWTGTGDLFGGQEFEQENGHGGY